MITEICRNLLDVGRSRDGARKPGRLRGCCMAKGREPVDDLLDALVWMRRKAKKHAPVDDLIDALIKMRRLAKKKLAKKKLTKRKVKKAVRSKSKQKQTPGRSRRK
jgi:hypothetical protein